MQACACVCAGGLRGSGPFSFRLVRFEVSMRYASGYGRQAVGYMSLQLRKGCS